MSGQQAKIVIIGGGAVGCAIAYHLTRMGERDVLLLEKAQLTHGCTWHAAGLVGQLRSKRNLTRLMQNSVRVFEGLAADTGQETDWKQVGSLRIAASVERMSEIKRSITQARGFGFEAELLSAEEAQKLFPFMSKDGVVGAAYIPTDGYIDPYALTQAYAKGARSRGATIREGVRVTDLEAKGGRITRVFTEEGPIDCEVVVNAGGLWARQVGAMARVPIAAGVVEHQYMVTEKAIDYEPGLPTFRDPDAIFYLKPDVSAFAIGGWEQGTKACWRQGAPWDFGRELFEGNFDRFEAVALPAAERIPLLNQVGIQTLINGPIPVSADGEPIMGPVPGLENFFVACGFTAGVAASGGAGEAMANWILEGDPGMDLWAFDVRRFGPHHAQSRFLEARAVEFYGRYYSIHWPGEESESGRGLRRSPLYGRLKHRGGVFGSKFGWERPLYFNPDKEDCERPSFEDKPGWFARIGWECDLVRNSAALIDQSSFSKFELSGPGAHEALQYLATKDLPQKPGWCSYTQLCNERGGIEADLTIMQPEEGRFYIVTGSGFGIRDFNWIREHLPKKSGLALREVTSAYGVINLCGPKAREVLTRVSDDDLSNEALPFLSIRRIEIGQAWAWASRVGYVGELGWELHCPVEMLCHIYETLLEAGAELGIGDVGYRAIDSLRLEKGYLYWSGDITPDYNPCEAGLGFCVDLDKGEFLGREALLRIKDEGVTRKLATFAIDGFAPLFGGEALLHDGKSIGYTTSGGYGHRTGKSIAFAYLPIDLAGAEDFEIEAFGRIYPARKGPRCLYDPKMERLRV
jgi:4-methylaminobutanoate oxidase (formaldehyde-forming)